MVNMMKILITILFLYTYFTFYFKGIYFFHVVLFHFLMIGYVIKNRAILEEYYIMRCNRTPLVIFFYGFGFCLFLGVVTLLFNMSSEIGFYYTFFKIPRQILCSLFLLVFLVRNVKTNLEVVDFGDYFINSCVVYVISTVIMMLVPEVRDAWFGIIEQTSTAEIATSQVQEYGLLLTRCGLRGFSGLDCGYYCSFAVFFLLYKILRSKKFLIYDLLRFVFLIAGNIFYSRTSLLVSVIGVGFTLTYLFLYNKKTFVHIISTILFIAMIIASLVEYNSDVEWIQWSFAPILGVIDYITGASTQISLGSSGDELMYGYSTYYIDDFFWSSLFGSGIYPNVDVGYIKQFSFYGMIGTLVYYLTFIIINISILSYHRKDNIEVAPLIIAIIISELVSEFKGEVMHFYFSAIVVFYFLGGEKLELNKGDIHE